LAANIASSVAVGSGGVSEVGGLVELGEELGDQLAATGHADLGEDRLDVVADGVGRQEQLVGDLGELRDTLGVLRDTGGRSPAAGLDRVAELVQLAREAGLDVKVEVASPPRELPPALDRAAYRILQEAVTNVLRHAGPARVAVSVGYGRDALVLRVTDDGRGSGDADHGAGQGIVGMRERAALLGGELTAGPRPGGGFQVLAQLPLQPGREESL
jgi:signal transduction histidine kinase